MSRDHIVRLLKESVRRLYRDEYGAIISSELALVGTVAVLAMAAGLESVSTAVNQELNDFANAIGSLNQSFSIRSFSGGSGSGKRTSFVSGSSFTNSARNSQLGGSGASSFGGGGGSSLVSDFDGQDIVSSFNGIRSAVNGVRSTGVQNQGVNTLEDCDGGPASMQGVLQVVPNSTFQVVPNSTFQVVPNSTFQVVPNSTFQVAPNSTLQVVPNSTFQVVPNSTLQVAPKSRCKTAPNSTFQIVPNSTLQVVPNSTFQVVPSPTFQVVPNSTLQIVPNSTLQIVPNSTLQQKCPPRGVQGQGGSVNERPMEEPASNDVDSSPPSNSRTTPKTKTPMPQSDR